MQWWVELGYHPFDEGKDGRPRTGQVVKYYREQKKDDAGKVYTQEALAKILGIKPRAIRAIENENAEMGIGRRDFLCELLNIPPELLGFCTLADIEQKVRSKDGTDLAEHSAYLARAKEQYRTVSASGIVESNAIRMQSLYDELQELLDTDSPHARRIRKLLFEYHILSSGAQWKRDLPSYRLAVLHADQALHVAPTDDLKLVSLLQLGDLYKTGGHLQESLATFQLAMEEWKEGMPSYLKGICLLYMGPLKAALAQDHTDKRAAMADIEQAGRMVRQLPSPLFKHGFDFSEQKYYIRIAETLEYTNQNQEALEALGCIKCNPVGWWQLQQNLLEAQAYINLGKYQRAIWYLDAGLSTVRAFKSDRITYAEALHKQLLASPYGKSSDVRYLGEMLGPVHA